MQLGRMMSYLHFSPHPLDIFHGFAPSFGPRVALGCTRSLDLGEELQVALHLFLHFLRPTLQCRTMLALQLVPVSQLPQSCVVAVASLLCPSAGRHAHGQDRTGQFTLVSDGITVLACGVRMVQFESTDRTRFSKRKYKCK